MHEKLDVELCREVAFIGIFFKGLLCLLYLPAAWYVECRCANILYKKISDTYCFLPFFKKKFHSSIYQMQFDFEIVICVKIIN